MGERWAGSSGVSQAAHILSKAALCEWHCSSRGEEATATGDVCDSNKEQRKEEQVDGGL